jgi:hypothetical protein
MTTPLREALTERINQVGPAHLDIEELVGLGEQRLRRRRYAAVAGSGVAVALAIALAIGGTSWNRSADQNSGPIDRPPKHPNRSQTITPTTTRPIVYTDDAFSDGCDVAGQPFFCVGTLHVGDRAVRIDQAVGTDRGWPMFVTDTGAIYLNADGRPGSSWDSVWFTDGGAPRQLAQQVCSGATTQSAGPLAAWVDCSTQARGDLVVFDTGTGSEVARLPIPGCRAAETKSASGRLAVEGCSPAGIVAGHVYFARAGYDETRNPPASRLLRLDLDTGDVVTATLRMYARDLTSDPRALVVGDSWRTGTRETGVGFAVVGSRLVPGAFDSSSDEFVATRARAFDAVTGRPVRLRLPAGFQPGPPPIIPPDGAAGSVRQFSVFEWLDDDTIALAQEGDNHHMGDMITCRLSDGACRFVAEAPPSDGPPYEIRLVAGQSLP